MHTMMLIWSVCVCVNCIVVLRSCTIQFIIFQQHFITYYYFFGLIPMLDFTHSVFGLNLNIITL